MKDFPLTRSARAAVIWSAVLVIPILLLSRSLVGGLYAALVLIYLAPVLLCTAGLCAGALPMALGLTAALVSMHMLAGEKGLIVGAVYLLPLVGAFVWIILRRIPFWKGCAVMIGVHVACFAALYALLQGWTEASLYQAAGKAAEDALRQWELGDYLLIELYDRIGVIQLTQERAQQLRDAMADSLRSGVFSIPEEVRKDMLLSVNALVSSQLESMVPGLIAGQSVLGGVGCLLLPLRFGYLAEEKRQFLRQDEEADETAKRTMNFPDLGMPPLRTWFIPRGMGWQVGVALAGGYLLQYSGTPALAVAGMILYSAASAVFSLQGLALLNYIQHMRNRKRTWRIIVPLLLMMTRLLMILGVFDQLVNLRGLRKPREPKEGI
ncbi:MAG: DUF2232 domain-containing protein [Clostridia bacterium]|nr:DUF2232 domain-containing protein [Clostridia bacterium]